MKKTLSIFTLALLIGIGTFVSFTQADTIQDFLNSLATKDLGLQIEGNAAFEKDLYVGENVGIGTANPTEKLTVDGVIKTSGGIEFNDGSVIDSANFNNPNKQNILGDGETTIDWNLGNNVDFTFNGSNENFSFIDPLAPGYFTLKIKQDNSGSRSALFPINIYWEDTIPPILSTGVNNIDLISLYFDGENYYENSVTHNLQKLQIPTEGLMAYYPFNNNANDESGNNNNGTVYGALNTQDRHANANSAYNFDGVNDYIELPANSSLYPSYFTYSAWIKPEAYDTNTNVGSIIFSNYFQENNIFYLSNSGKISIRLHNGTSGEDLKSINTIPLDTYSYVVASSDGETLKLYINGILDKSLVLNYNYSPSVASMNPRIGRPSWHNNETSIFDGTIDEVRIYNRALSDIEVRSLYSIN